MAVSSHVPELSFLFFQSTADMILFTHMRAIHLVQISKSCRLNIHCTAERRLIYCFEAIASKPDGLQFLVVPVRPVPTVQVTSYEARRDGLVNRGWHA